MKLRGIIFDLDGTLADTLPVCFEAFRQVLREYLGRHYTDEQVRQLLGPSEIGIFNDLIPHRSREALASYLNSYERAHRYCREPFKGIRQILLSLKERDVRCAIVTGKGSESAAISLEILKLADFFSVVEAGSPNGANKPTAMKRILDFWKLQSNQVASIGDSQADINAAKEAGIIALGAAWAKTSDPSVLVSLNPAAVFSSTAEFENWINEHATSNRNS